MTIEVANGTDREFATKALLVEILDAYPLDRWRYTDHIQVSEREIPHSHPVLTISAHHNPDNPLRLISSYIHEQLHWFWLLEAHGDRRNRVLDAFKAAFPAIPIEPPDGCGSETSNNLHLAINYWELESLCDLIGEESARSFVAAKPFYRAVYAIVLKHTDVIEGILDAQEMLLPMSPPASRKYAPAIDDPDL